MLRKFTGLRTKVFLIISITFVVLFLGQLLIARFTLFEGQLNLLKRRAYVNAERTEKVLFNEIAQLDARAKDWTEWHDTYQFVKDSNAVYSSPNLVTETFTDLNLNFLIVADTTGKIVYAQEFDLQKQQLKALSKELIALISQKHLSLLRPSPSNARVAGIILLDKEAMLISARAILPSLEKGTVGGTLIMGRLLNGKQFEKLSQIMQLNLTSYSYNDPQLPADFRLAKSQFSSGKAIAVQSLADNTIVSYLLVRDILGKPALVIRIDMDASIYTQIRGAFNYYSWTTLIIGLVFCLLFLLLLNRLILSRVSYLIRKVSQISSTGNLSIRIALLGNDELSSLASTLNQMLKQLQQSQKAYQESEERYFLAVAGANDGIWDWNISNNQIYFSPRWKAILGYEDEEISNDLDEWFQRIHPQEIEPLKWGIEIHLNGQTPHFEYEYQIRHKDGTYRWVLCRGLAVLDEAGIAYRMAGSMSDITKRKITENALAQRTIELTRSNAELEQFAYVASHDLQEPLRKIETFGDRLKAKFGHQLNEQGNDYIERMQMSARRLRTLIEDLLDFSRVTRRSQPFILVNLNAVIDEIICDLEGQINATKGTIEVAKLPSIEADSLQMRQLFQNLLSNALKFSRKSETPRIAIECSILKSPQQWCEIAVKDNGIGFDEKYSDRIFQVFQRLHGRSEYEGTGIGLAICAKIVARHGGSLCAKSIPGVGSTFIVQLPLKQAPSHLTAGYETH
jgi:PAS domain S-box-containing protein